MLVIPVGWNGIINRERERRGGREGGWTLTSNSAFFLSTSVLVIADGEKRVNLLQSSSKRLDILRCAPLKESRDSLVTCIASTSSVISCDMGVACNNY